jgi:nitrate/nitrite transporter NarK
MVYGIATLAASALFLIFNREQPPTPPCPPGHDERIAVLAGLKHIFKQKDMIYMTIIFFIALGIFNAITTWVEQILAPRGFTITQAGTAGAINMIGGILGACILPILSDRLRKRKFFILISTLLALPGMVGLTFTTSFGMVLLSSLIMGFFSMGGGPVSFQYAAEVSYPAPEATSQGILMLAGQISGIIFILGMDVLMAGTPSKTPAMLVFIALTVLNLFFIMKLKESRLVKSEEI